MRARIKLPDVTLVTVSSLDLLDTIDALVYNLRGVEFASVKLISHEKPQGLPAQVEFGRCEKITNLDEYSKFMIYDLGEFIDTPYCLTVQRDGVIVNPQRWRDEFLNFDFIGAPWPEDDAFRDPAGTLIRVGNGGFSLRSRKFLQVAKTEKIPFVSSTNCLHEDAWQCVVNRATYLKNGIRFAGIDTAKYFSHEFNVPEIKGIKPFGFHKYRKQNRFYPRFPSRFQRYLRKFLPNSIG
jgi:hypothetical protein